ncbi:SAM-dependent methyltransferase [Thermomonospora umbrina]|uniref:S-adenosyl methyltransferase n=1 Tax=Thermomonospora umbrina TaxID=111806 RepID=A0A3D9SXU1_9ACTN|nr:SAM-dependent methyltransferase [Thermomonospora umbrina]REE96421.1 S-adenosyl methyltransferase [Thermomonospora umbrina]
MTKSVQPLDVGRGEDSPALAAGGPTIARFHNAMLSGKDNFAADRRLAREVTALAPTLPRLFRHDRRFVARSVQEMVRRGVTQILDLGCGLPTHDNTHEIAQRFDPQTRVVYVDHDPTVVAHGRAILASDPRAAVVGADIRAPATVLGTDGTHRLLDLSRPVGVLLTSVLHHIPVEDDPHGIVRSYMEALPSGSMLALSHFHAPEGDGPRGGQAARVERALLAALGSGWFRSRPAIEAFFDGLELDEHGVRPLFPWHPGRTASLALCGLAHRP